MAGIENSSKGQRSPFFSIVTVTLDAGDLLLETALSVDAQDLRDFEHIVKDGGSTDGSIAKLPWSGRRSVVVQGDSGIYDAMNQALMSCNGQYVLFLNAGDLFVRSDTLSLFRTAAMSGADVIYCDIVNGEFGQPVSYPARLGAFFLFRNTVCHQACCIRRDLLTRLGGFDCSLTLCADHEFLTRSVVGARAVAKHLPVPAVWYQGFGASSKDRARSRHEFSIIRSRHYPTLRRLLYSVVHGATWPGLRSKMLSSPHFTAVRRSYVSIRNAIYRDRTW